MKYEKAKEIAEKYFSDDGIIIKFGWKFKLYPRLRRQTKEWARQVLEGEDEAIQ